jgi:hypothetical protein
VKVELNPPKREVHLVTALATAQSGHVLTKISEPQLWITLGGQENRDGLSRAVQWATGWAIARSRNGHSMIKQSVGGIPVVWKRPGVTSDEKGKYQWQRVRGRGGVGPRQMMMTSGDSEGRTAQISLVS